MKKALALLVATVAVLAATASASAAGAIHFTESVVGEVIPCDNGLTLTATSGYISGVLHEGTSASGNMNITGTFVPVGVTLAGSDGNTYHAAGATWFGGALNAQTGGFTFTDTEHIVFVGPGGVVGKVSTTTHVSPNGQEVSVDMSSCTLPEEEE
jgi:hypothetical protein